MIAIADEIDFLRVIWLTYPAFPLDGWVVAHCLSLQGY